MSLKVQQSNINTFQKTNINQSANKSPSSVANKASHLQNNAELRPVIAEKEIRNPELRQMSSMTKAPSIKITTEKTVHKKDINGLKSRLANIESKINRIITNDRSAWVLSPNEVKADLDKLKNSITRYQKLLDSSSYNHASFKQKELTKLQDNAKKTTKHLELADTAFKTKIERSSRAYLDNKQAHIDFINGNKKPSKFDIQ
ncbi:hypothetical protein [Providencia rettgeri]|uniref:hypothetical protein n=1 Tax=Providencia rettgeri TaxID=587 RepID=UPI0034E0D125